jgi:hypothetical protein
MRNACGLRDRHEADPDDRVHDGAPFDHRRPLQLADRVGQAVQEAIAGRAGAHQGRPQTKQAARFTAEVATLAERPPRRRSRSRCPKHKALPRAGINGPEGEINGPFDIKAFYFERPVVIAHRGKH